MIVFNPFTGNFDITGGGNGSTFNPASPGAIGGTTPAAITGTTITATTAYVSPLGSVGTPAMTAGDADSGWYFPDAKSIAWTVDGGTTGSPEFKFSKANGFQVGTPTSTTGGDKIILFEQGGGSSLWTVGAFGGEQYFGFTDSGSAGNWRRVEATTEIYMRLPTYNATGMGIRQGNAGATFYVRLAATPTGNAQEWQDSAAAVLAKVGPAGTMTPLVTVVGSLPAAATSGVGARAFVTDGSTTLILGLGLAVIGGGANKVPIYSDGTNWVIGG